MIAPSERFRDFYHHLYEQIIIEFREETGENLKEYKDYEPDLLIKFYENFSDEENILDQMTRLLSGLITLQALPNANHRAAFRFIDFYLGFACKDKMRTFLEDKELYDTFYRKSKPIIDFEINHGALFNDKYMDSHHSMGIENHLKYSKELLEKIVSAQSGMMEAVPFQRFITSLYHSSSNQAGSS